MRIRIVLSVATIAFAVVSVAAGRAPQKPSFEVVSIKPNVSGGGGGTGMLRPEPGGRLTAEGVLLRFFIQAAYGVRSYQISGGPVWIDSDRFDIQAKAAGSVTNDQMQQMMQALLEDRFRLRTHRETRDLPVYDLTIAKEGFKPQSVPAVTCVEPTASRPIPQPGQNILCGQPIVSANTNGVQMTGGKVMMADFTRVLSNLLGRTVIDKTAYSDTFDVHLEFAMDDALAGMGGGPNAPGRPAIAPDPAGRSIFTALQEQLGLRLVASKGPVEVLVIDSVQKPTAN